MAKPEEYGISVRLVQEEGSDLYEARVAELPDVRTYGETYTEAYLGAVEVIRTTQQIFAEKGKHFPDVERPEDEFSGRVTLRMSKSLHRAIHERAQKDEVSLNQWVVEAVSLRVNQVSGSRLSSHMSSLPNLKGALQVFVNDTSEAAGAHRYSLRTTSFDTTVAQLQNSTSKIFWMSMGRMR